MATNYRQAISRAFDTTSEALKVLLSAGTAVLGKIRLVTATGDEVTEDTNDSVKITIVADDVGIGGGTQYQEDAQHSSGATGTLSLVVRKDTATQLAGTDGDYSIMITDANGRLHVLDQNSADIKTAVEAINTALQSSGITQQQLDAIKTAVELLDNAVSGSELQVDIVASIPAGTNVIGKIRLVTANGDEITDDTADAIKSKLVDASGTDAIGEVQATPTSNTILARLKDLLTGIVLAAGTAVIGKVGHDKTGIGHGVKTVTTAGTDEALAGSTAAKVVIIQAQTDNTGAIAVGASGVDATVATGTGVLLYAGDTVTLEIDNLADVYVDSTVNGEGVRYTYLT